MTTRFRINAIHIDTVEGAVDFVFSDDIIVLTGPTGVGKTTLFELVKFGFGGRGKLAPVVRTSVIAIQLDLTVGNERYAIKRSVDADKAKVVQVTDLRSHERLVEHHVDRKKTPSLNSLLMGALGLPDDVRAAARGGGSSRSGDIVTFNDVFSFLYVAQSEINRDIAGSQMSYVDPKRKTVFELLFLLTNEEIQGLRSRYNELRGEIASAEAEHRTVRKFLADSGTGDRFQTEIALAEAARRQADGEARFAELRDAVDPVSDRRTRMLRDLLTEAEVGAADARATLDELNRQRAEYTAERDRLASDIARLARMHDAGARLANFEFAVCPRCLQSLSERSVPIDACRVCLQPDPVQPGVRPEQYETRQLQDQRSEVDDQLHAIALKEAAISGALAERAVLVTTLNEQLEERTAERITPRLQAFADVTDQLATARVEQGHLESILRQWDRADDLGLVTDRLRLDRTRVKRELDEASEALESRRTEIFDEIDAEFQATVADIGIPGVETAVIDRSTYLPLLNGESFTTTSSAGGIITATQIAYWTSLLSVATRRGDTYYPAFLLIDSPQLALNAAAPVVAAIYRRMATQSTARPGQLQLIVADNETPEVFKGTRLPEIPFDYDNPTIKAIRHPGPAGVQTLEDLAD
ncbi:AAA family ATPase [Kribbella endophytica]